MNAKALGGLTALHIAAHYSHVEVVRQLLHFGADLTIAASRTGHTALHVATRQELVTEFNPRARNFANLQVLLLL